MDYMKKLEQEMDMLRLTIDYKSALRRMAREIKKNIDDKVNYFVLSYHHENGLLREVLFDDLYYIIKNYPMLEENEYETEWDIPNCDKTNDRMIVRRVHPIVK